MTQNFSEIQQRLIFEYCENRELGAKVPEIMEKLYAIDKLRNEKNAIILAHYYQIPPIQMIADMKGDSLKLAQYAEKIGDKDLVVSSTVVFMAEMIKLLSPDKKVVVPDLEAGCSIASGINGESVKKIREAFPGSGIVAYINTYADTKSQVDTVCTSANAHQIIKNLQGNPIISLPDYFFFSNIIKNLLKNDDGREYIVYKGRDSENLILENFRNKEVYRIPLHLSKMPELEKGVCIVHEQFDAERVKTDRKIYEVDAVLSHPEVNPDVAAVSDFVGGTNNMLDYVGKSGGKKFLVITECDLTAPLKETFPEKQFITPCTICPFMKRNSLDGLINSLKNEVHEIKLDDQTSYGARRSLERMFELMKK